MQTLEYLVRLMDRLAMALSGFLSLTLVSLTLADVIGRNAFNAPIQGAFEITQILMAALIFTAMPSVCVRSEHVAIDFVDRVVPKRVLKILVRFAALLTGICMAVLAWRLFLMGRAFANDGHITSYLLLPVAPVAYYIATAAALAAGMTFAQMFSSTPLYDAFQLEEVE